MFNLEMLIPNGFFFKKIKKLTSPKQVNICNQIEISCGNYLFSWGLIFAGENSTRESFKLQ